MNKPDRKPFTWPDVAMRFISCATFVTLVWIAVVVFK